MKGFLRSQPDANIISVSQNDNGNYCQTPEEKAIMDEEGSPMGPLLRAGECSNSRLGRRRLLPRL